MFMFVYNIQSYLEIGLFLFYVGLAGVLLNHSNLLISILSIELMFYGLNYYVLLNAYILGEIDGFVISIFILTLAAAESALALAILMIYFKKFKNILL